MSSWFPWNRFLKNVQLLLHLFGGGGSPSSLFETTRQNGHATFGLIMTNEL
jgi:hypothetical protein